MKIGDEVTWMRLTWTVTYMFDTRTEHGVMACLSREDDSKRLKVDRCNALVQQIEKGFEIKGYNYAAQSCE